MKDPMPPRSIRFRILLLVGAAIILAAVWLALNPPGGDRPDTAPSTPDGETATPPAPALKPGQPELPTPEKPLDLPAAPSVKQLGNGRYRVGTVEFDENQRTISIPAAVHMLAEPVEYLLVSRHGKVHETVLSPTPTPATSTSPRCCSASDPSPDSGLRTAPPSSPTTV